MRIKLQLELIFRLAKMEKQLCLLLYLFSRLFFLSFSSFFFLSLLVRLWPKQQHLQILRERQREWAQPNVTLINNCEQNCLI